MPVDPSSILPPHDAETYRQLSQDLYDSLMKALQSLWFDAPFGATENREASEVCIRSRRVLGISPDLTKVVRHD